MWDQGEREITQAIEELRTRREQIDNRIKVLEKALSKFAIDSA